MADISPLVPEGRQVIQSYGGGGFRISGVDHRGSVIVFPTHTVPWDVAALAAATRENLALVMAPDARVAVLLVGAGRVSPGVLKPELRTALREAGVVAEVMDTGAACRTFNVLMAEERRVAAALIAIQ
jgi:uncharacterized protein